MAIQSTAIGTGNTDLYVSNGNTAVTCIWVCNTVTYNPVDPTSNLTYLDLHFVKQGAGITATNLIVSQLAVPAGETVSFDTEKIILDNMFSEYKNRMKLKELEKKNNNYGKK